MTDKFYTGTCYIGVVGSNSEIGECRDSIQNIKRRPGDALPAFIRGTKGYETRQAHVNRFKESEHAFILLLDHDMVFDEDTLERLRSHGRAYVTGAYMRRTYAPIRPVWFKDNPDLVWPYEPETEVLSRDRLHPVGASGWGCILIHRDVFTAVEPLLKGEPEVIEDDMDIWPYDLERVMGALAELRSLSLAPDIAWDTDTRHLIYGGINMLTEELRPLRGTKDPVGSDLRFPFFARVAGFQLWLDPNVRPGHKVDYSLTPDDYDNMPAETLAIMNTAVREAVLEDRARMEGIYNALVNMPVEPEKKRTFIVPDGRPDKDYIEMGRKISDEIAKRMGAR